MLVFHTPRHQVFVQITGVNGDPSLETAGYARVVDDAIDLLYLLSKDDVNLNAALDACTTREEAYVHLSRNMQAALPEKWMRDGFGSDACRRVLYLMRPQRFGFEEYGWIQ